MKQIMIAALLIGAASLGGSTAAGQPSAQVARLSGSAIERSYGLDNFDSIYSAGPHRVVVAVGPSFSVKAEGAAETLDVMEVYVKDGALRIRPKDNQDHRWDFDAIPVGQAVFYVTLPRLHAAAVAGSGGMNIDRINGEGFAASLAGSGNLEIGDLTVGTADFSIAGSGSLSARGTARQSKVSITGSGALKARDVSSEDASVSITGSGDVRLTVRHEATVSMIGGGDVEIAGSARCSVSRIGGGKVRCGETAGWSS